MVSFGSVHRITIERAGPSVAVEVVHKLRNF